MAYTDIAYCDTVLSSTAWVASTDTEKQTAIDMGELWIDAEYSCVADSPVQTSIQMANALLADKYINSVLFAVNEGEIESKSVKAGSVETERTYFKGASIEDSFAEIKMLLNSECSINHSSVFVTLRV